MDERVLNPGPGAYESGNPDKYKFRSPSYSISSRTNIPTDQTQKPGPGAHSPEKVRKTGSYLEHSNIVLHDNNIIPKRYYHHHS